MRRAAPGGLGLRIPLGAAAVAALAGCATLGGLGSHPFHRHYRAGEYAEAARIFEQDSSLQRREKALYRASIMYALPESPVRSRARATVQLRRLLELYPQSEYRRESASLLAVLTRVDSLELRLDRVRDRLRRLKAIDLGRTPEDTAGRF